MALTRTTEQSETLVVEMSAADAFDAATGALAKVGKVKASQEKFGRIVGRVRSGSMNMNSAELTVHVESVGPTQARLTFHAIAQEGLIPQNTAAKAITRVLDGM
jgi:hypothetical protein